MVFYKKECSQNGFYIFLHCAQYIFIYCAFVLTNFFKLFHYRGSLLICWEQKCFNETYTAGRTITCKITICGTLLSKLREITKYKKMFLPCSCQPMSSFCFMHSRHVLIYYKKLFHMIRHAIYVWKKYLITIILEKKVTDIISHLWLLVGSNWQIICVCRFWRVKDNK